MQSKYYLLIYKSQFYFENKNNENLNFNDFSCGLDSPYFVNMLMIPCVTRLLNKQTGP